MVGRVSVADLMPEPVYPGEVWTEPGDLGFDLYERFDRLHEVLYTRGGIRPVNAAIEELAKIVLLQIKHARDPSWRPFGQLPLSEILDPDRLSHERDAESVKAAFRAAIGLPEFAALLPDGGRQPIWPPDEPFRLTQADVLAQALTLIGPALLREVVASRSFDLLGTAFDALLRGRYDHSGGLATYLTPHNVAELLAEVCFANLTVPDDWRSGTPIFGDLCCGTGRFLVAGIREARRRANERFGDGAEAERFLDAYAGSGIVGADQSASAVAKARLNLILFGISHPSVFAVRDSIVDRALDRLAGRMQLILTNPPFGDSKYDEPDGVARTTAVLRRLGNRTAVDPGLAFVVRCLDLLGEGGHLGIILPDGLVDGAALRAALLSTDSGLRLRDVSLEANISLPSATFALSGTVARTSAVVLRKGGAERSSVVLARALHCGHLKQGGKAVPDPSGDDLPAIAKRVLEAWREPDVDLPEGLRILSERPAVTLVERDGLATADPSRVDPAAQAAKHDLLQEGGMRLEHLLRPVRSKSVRADGSLPFVSVLHVDAFGAVSWSEAREYVPTTPGVRAEPHSVLLSMLNPRKLRATVVPDEIGHVLCSSEFGVFEADDPWAVLVVLHDARVRAQLAPLGRGTSSSRRRIDVTDLFTVVVPRIDAEIRRRGKRLRDAHAMLRRGADAAYAALSLNGTS
jgi:type I restriction enzyme M protein